jgi:hypothetical protein
MSDEPFLKSPPGKDQDRLLQGWQAQRHYPNVRFDLLGSCFRPRLVQTFRATTLFCRFTPAVSVSAMKAMWTIRELGLRHQTELSMADIAGQINPLLRGWIARSRPWHLRLGLAPRR